MKRNELPKQCLSCDNLHAWNVYSDGSSCYHCKKIVAFWQNKPMNCPCYEGGAANA